MTNARRPVRLLAALCGLVLLAACAGKGDLDQPPPPLGPFKLGLNIVVAKNAQKSPVSRSATAAEWEAALKQAMVDRFGRYKGDKFYDFGINVDGYALAPPGIPIVLSPKSVLVITVNIWDDPAQKLLNEKPKQITVLEGLNGETLIGSGLIRNKKKQMEVLSYNAVKAIEKWLLKHPEWFEEPAAGSGTGAAASDGAKTDSAASATGATGTGQTGQATKKTGEATRTVIVAAPKLPASGPANGN
ncbi:hypothetical protein [Acidimangrovimonas pyrenivorans]|uniref:DUF4136 domain-containing protein n=1 Tax=Acidimangrovimonas pyrenivorans TaxID=2030798 RepID=A0ABV7ADE5_9RHOB